MIDPVKESYIRFQGSTFHLAREDSAVYERYKAMNPGEDLLRKWDEEILEGLFEKLWEDEDIVWNKHNSIIKVLNRRHVDLNYWVSHLLDEMEKMTELDKRNKIIIIETMSGHNSKEDEGGVHLICLYTDLEARMVKVMNELKNFFCDDYDNLNEIGWNNIIDRHLCAVNDYVRVYKKYGKLNLSTL